MLPVLSSFSREKKSRSCDWCDGLVAKSTSCKAPKFNFQLPYQTPGVHFSSRGSESLSEHFGHCIHIYTNTHILIELKIKFFFLKLEVIYIKQCVQKPNQTKTPTTPKCLNFYCCDKCNFKEKGFILVHSSKVHTACSGDIKVSECEAPGHTTSDQEAEDRCMRLSSLSTLPY